MLRAENSKRMKGDIGGVKVKSKERLQVPHPKNRKLVKEHQVPGKIDTSKTQTHLTRTQLAASEYRPEDKSLYSGLNIKGTRKIPDLQAQVDMLIGAVQNLAPSLDSRPSFGQELPVPGKLAAFSASSFSCKSLAIPTGGEDPEIFSDEEFDEEPHPRYRFRWRRDANGKKYNVEEKLPVEQ